MLLQRIGNRGIGLGTLWDRAAEKHPATTVRFDHDLEVADGLGRVATVAQLAAIVADLAARLAAMGVGRGDHVVVHRRHSADIVLLEYAVARLGAVPVMLSPQLDGATVAQLVDRVATRGAPVLVTDRATIDAGLPRSMFTQLRLTVLSGGSKVGLDAAAGDGQVVALADFDGAPAVAAVITGPDEPALVTHTSGTTGLPKLAVHTNRTLQARYRPQALVTLPIVRREVVAIHVSFVHSRLVTALAISLLRGCPVVLLADDDLDRIATLFAEVRPGVVEAHPNCFLEWEQLADDPREPFAGVKLFSSTFDALHPRTVHRLLGASRRRGAVFGQLYGQSEIGPTLVRGYTRRRDPLDDGRCVGVPFPGMTGVRVVSRNGRPPTRDNPGYLEIRSDGRVVTFLGDETEQQRHAGQLTDGWWRMGDVGYRTRRGCVHLLDREVDMIEGFGSTLAAEDHLFGMLPDLIEVVFVAGVDGRAVPVVCTRGDTPVDPADWKTAAAGLPPMADPVQRRLEQLPRTATLKIKRVELAAELARTATAGTG